MASAQARKRLPLPKQDLVVSFKRTWAQLFNSPVHLDSLLSKQPPSHRAILAQALPSILRRPSSLADHFHVRSGTPWSLSQEDLIDWHPASRIFEKWLDFAEGHYQPGASHADTQPTDDEMDAMISHPKARPVFQLPAIETPPSFRDFPPALLEQWDRHWGQDVTRGLTAALSRAPTYDLRVHMTRDREKVARATESEAWLAHGYHVDIEPTPMSPFGLRLNSFAPIRSMKIFTDGAFEVQDEGSQLMALFALKPSLVSPLLSSAPSGNPLATDKSFGFTRSALGLCDSKMIQTKFLQPGQIVVDACAGSGGKSLAMAELMRGKGRVYSYDISHRKLKTLMERATRSGLSNIYTKTLLDGDEASMLAAFSTPSPHLQSSSDNNTNSSKKGKKDKAVADVVLVDAPCSGWGSLRRNPDIKWKAAMLSAASSSSSVGSRRFDDAEFEEAVYEPVAVEEAELDDQQLAMKRMMEEWDEEEMADSSRLRAQNHKQSSARRSSKGRPSRSQEEPAPMSVFGSPSHQGISSLPDVQLRLLGVYSALVKPGGRLVYGVCTFSKSETVDVVQKFLAAHEDFEATEGGFMGPGSCDGFFMQSFRRRA